MERNEGRAADGLKVRREGRVSSSHGTLAFFDVPGPGPAIVFLHGNSFCKEVFLPLCEAMSRRHRLIAFDLPGHGDSDHPHDPYVTYRLEGYADCLVEALGNLGVSDAIFVGWSLGGHVGYEIARCFGGTLGVVTIATPPFECFPDGSWSGFLPNPRLALAGKEILSEQEASDFATTATGIHGPANDAWCRAVIRTDGRARRMLFEALSTSGYRGQRQSVERLPIPVILAVGEHDPFVDVGYLREVAASLRFGKAAVFAGQSHAPHLHAASEVAELLEGFAASLSRAGRSGEELPKSTTS